MIMGLIIGGGVCAVPEFTDLGFDIGWNLFPVSVGLGHDAVLVGWTCQ
jgi:hypothetical protein